MAFVDPAAGARLQAQLKPGQRLVSQGGGLWRWDGLTAAGDTPSASAKRLSERNRLTALENECTNALALSLTAEKQKTAALEAYSQAEAQENDLKRVSTESRQKIDQLTATQRAHERANQDNIKREAALEQGLCHLKTSLGQSRDHCTQAQNALDAMDDVAKLQGTCEAQQKSVAQSHQAQSTAAFSVSTLKREREISLERLSQIEKERETWHRRVQDASTHIANLEDRIAKAETELEAYHDLPAKLTQQQASLMNALSQAEHKRQQASDRLVEAETALKQHDQQLKVAQSDVMNAREERARIETRLETAREKCAITAKQIKDTLGCLPQDCLALSNVDIDQTLPKLQTVEGNLSRLKTEREGMGGVNLQAEDEINALEQQFGTMSAERSDLEQAIARLREAIDNLNQEGRGRLMTAFNQVNDHFKRLFQTLFGGGEAELQLVESDDPLEAGLEIIACPPGKKPQVLTLLSGGEKALTAMSLIFAVFLTNPSPICVLDEVDAPLDDSNVDRFCNMMEEMKASTNTRFLVITHHPMTMARMNRLFGVTMSEKGVSQLVSVDLTAAEVIREAS